MQVNIPNVLNVTKGIKNPFQNLFAPLLSLFLFSVGIGFVSTLVPILLHKNQTAPWILGLMSTASYTGLVFGSFRTEKIIMRIGHIRSFSFFGSILTVSTLLHGMIDIFEMWILLRFISGICLAGLYVVVESWLLSGTPFKTRGKILSFYMLTLYMGQGCGQFLMKFDNCTSSYLFCLATVFVSLSIFPLSITKAASPKIEEPSVLEMKLLFKNSLSGSIGSFCAGIIMGALYGLYPVFVMKEFAENNIEYFMSALIFGGMLLQYPVGRISDIIERRTVLYTIFLLSHIICLVLIFLNISPFWGIVLSFLLGGFTFTIYPICISHACDTTAEKDIVATVQGLLLIYSIGAALGPIMASFFINIGKGGLMIFIGSVSLLCGLFIYFRRSNTPAVIQEERFIPSAQTSPVLSELDPRGENP